MLKVLGHSASINVRKVLWLCAELGLPYEQEPWGQGPLSTQSPEFLRRNPNALVPVLIDGDFVLSESNTICRYLANKCGRTDLLPSDPIARARVEQWMDWGATELNGSWRYAFTALIRKTAIEPDSILLAQSVANWNRHMQILDGVLEKTVAYAAGSSFTLADVVLGLGTNRWWMTPIEHAVLPAVQDYYYRLSERPAFLLHVRNGMP